jgi:hypothetical protein
VGGGVGCFGRQQLLLIAERADAPAQGQGQGLVGRKRESVGRKLEVRRDFTVILQGFLKIILRSRLPLLKQNICAKQARVMFIALAVFFLSVIFHGKSIHSFSPLNITFILYNNYL